MNAPFSLPPAGKVLGIGCDLVEVSRIQDAHERHGQQFLDKVFSQGEQDHCLQQPNPHPALAARFAAKEAIAKAFRTGIGAEFGWRDAGIENGPAGDPVVLLSDKGSALLAERGGREILVSLSHVSAMAIAMAVITK